METVPDILHDLPIQAPRARVFETITSPAGLDRWWTKRSSGVPSTGALYTLLFGEQHDWRARVARCEPPFAFELEITQAEPDWMGTRVGFELVEKGAATQLRFHHAGWSEASEHYRISSFCWAMYLRVLKRYLEQGETVPYDDRLEA